jgi:8-oxo-dGTP diphosphatase
MAQKPIQAAGGVVVRNGARALVAVVQRAKDDSWVLPRGKLERNENAAAGAKREVVEETGHRVDVHEFLGAITYRVRGRPKLVQFWRMQAAARPSRDVMSDIVAVEWLPLSAAVRRLSYPLEKLFLQHAGRRALKRRRRKARRNGAGRRKKMRRQKAARKTARKSAAARQTRRRTKAATRQIRKGRHVEKSRQPQRSVQPNLLRRLFAHG